MIIDQCASSESNHQCGLHLDISIVPIPPFSPITLILKSDWWFSRAMWLLHQLQLWADLAEYSSQFPGMILQPHWLQHSTELQEQSNQSPGLVVQRHCLADFPQHSSHSGNFHNTSVIIHEWLFNRIGGSIQLNCYINVVNARPHYLHHSSDSQENGSQCPVDWFCRAW